ncbi:thiamine pyrophosphate-binding protein [Micromonospora sp. MMS20-R2-29]|uniref:Thiamine pyrophosphate-binding protein n=1 Tax=Micromonospora humidisoli TaxID=2807622 RepID=A0ABS2J486_9ACTN|nr:thiamine pyrophosphate-binding protein [Micromonospora humidisoli]
MEQFAADGLTYMFGNPGTVEQGLIDEVTDSEIDYLLTLHESVAVGMADGYARATQRPALVQLHSGVGLGNGIGMLYQAKRGGSPLVVLAGEAGVRYDAMDSQMAADLVAMARPVTKYATRVIDPASLLRVMRRAVKIAMTPPRGPVLVVVPADVLDANVTDPVVPTVIPDTRVLPEPAVLAAAAEILAAGRRPLVLFGDGVATSGAQRELAAVAELLGAPMWGVNSSEVNVDSRHPLYGGQLGHMFGADSARTVADADTVLIVGTYVFPEVFPELTSPFAPDARIVHVDLDAYEIAKNHPVELGVVADPRLTLAGLAARLDRPGRQRPPRWDGAAPPGDEPGDDAGLMNRFVRTLVRRAPDDLVIFDEALTESGPLAVHAPPRVPGRFFQTRGGSLGVGIPGALGVKLARPSQQVVGFTGDGGSMYTIQALWTAARHDIGAKFVICNNRRYRLLDLNIEQYWRDGGIPAHLHPDAFDLSRPAIDFAALSRSLGVPAQRVSTPQEVPAAVEELLATPGPFLIDLVTD